MNNNNPKIELTKKHNFEELVRNISHTHEVLQSYASKSVNQFLSLRNWVFGYYVVEYEQNGEDRAKYGENLMANLAEKVKHIKGLTGNQLYICCNFYLTYPHFLRTVNAKLQFFDLEQNVILRSLTVKSQIADNESDAILRSVTVKSQNSENNNNAILRSLTAKSQIINNEGIVILQSATAKSLSPEILDGDNLNPEFLLSNLTFTHFVELIRISDPLQRLFYEVETIKNNWSVRELKRAIGTQLALRTTLSVNKEAEIKMTHS